MKFFIETKNDEGLYCKIPVITDIDGTIENVPKRYDEFIGKNIALLIFNLYNWGNFSDEPSRIYRIRSTDITNSY